MDSVLPEKHSKLAKELLSTELYKKHLEKISFKKVKNIMSLLAKAVVEIRQNPYWNFVRSQGSILRGQTFSFALTKSFEFDWMLLQENFQILES